MEWQYGLIALLVILTFILIVICWYSYNIHKKIYNDYLYGIWRGEIDFCNDAGISDMILHLNKIENNCMFGYLIICDANGVSINEPIKFNLNYIQIYNEFNCQAELEGRKSLPFPKNINIKFSMDDGYLMLYDDSTVYAKLYKDMYSTDQLRITRNEKKENLAKEKAHHSSDFEKI